jgi:hypothetical protein
MLQASKTRVSKKIAKFGLISNKQAPAITFYPIIVQDDVHHHKHYKYRSQARMNISPVVPADSMSQVLAYQITRFA